jgi:hypothetical protein
MFFSAYFTLVLLKFLSLSDIVAVEAQSKVLSNLAFAVSEAMSEVNLKSVLTVNIFRSDAESLAVEDFVNEFMLRLLNTSIYPFVMSVQEKQKSC